MDNTASGNRVFLMASNGPTTVNAYYAQHQIDIAMLTNLSTSATSSSLSVNGFVKTMF
jgi:hypothetical protein